jgi:hypothetical protein
MLKKIATSLLLIVLNLVAHAQLPASTIQVLIEENVELKVSEYVYRVSDTDISEKTVFDLDYGFGYDEDEDDEYDYNSEDEDEDDVLPDPLTLAEIKTKLEANKFVCTTVPNGNYNIDPDRSYNIEERVNKSAIEVRVKSLDELKKLCLLVSKMEGAHGELVDIMYEDIATTYATLFPKMMQKATEKATIIASASGKKIGMLLQVTERQENASLYGDELSDYMEKMMEFSTKLWQKNVPTSKSEKVEFTYIFELK